MSTSDETLRLHPDDPHATPATAPGRRGGPGPAPTALGPYAVIGLLGAGAMGAVYRVRHPRLGKDYAAKVLLAGEDAGPETLLRFRREAESMARLDAHPNVVGVHDVGQDGPRHYLVMDLVDGPTLHALVQGEALPVRRAVEICRDVALGLHHAHTAGVLHRDVKPGNILVDSRGTARLSDFGLARAMGGGGDLTLPGSVVGTPIYTSPEQASGRLDQLDARSDVYGLGAVLYEMLTGATPVEGDQVLQILTRVVSEDPIPPRIKDPAIPVDVERICLTAMAKSPPRRYASARAMAEDCERWLRGDAVVARAPSPWRRAWARAARSPGRLAAAGVALAAVAGTVAGIGIASRRASPAIGGGAGAATAATAATAAAADRARAAEARRDAAAAHRAEGRRAIERADRAQRRQEMAAVRALRGEAADAYGAAVAADPDDGEAWLLLGRVQLALGRLGPASDALARAVALRPGDAEALVEQSRAWFVSHMASRAKFRWQQAGLATDASPPSAEAAAAPARVQAAVAALRQSGAPEARIRYVEGLAAWLAGDGTAAAAALHAAVAADPYAADARLAFGALLESTVDRGGGPESGSRETARLERALAVLAEAAALDPTDPRILAGRAAAAYALRRLPDLRPELRAAAAADPVEPLWSYLLGKAEVMAGDAVAALAAFDEALRRDPRFPEALLDRGGLRAATDPEGALADLDAALAVTPEIAEAWFNRGALRGRRREFAAAIADMDEALKRRPGWAQALANRAAIKWNAGEHDAALDDADAALAADPGYPLAALIATSARLRLGDADAAAAAADAGLAREPGRVELRALRSLARALRGDLDGATADCTPETLAHPAARAARYWVQAETDPEAAIRSESELPVFDATATPWALASSGRARQRSGDRAGAEERWARVAAEWPEHPVLRHVAGWRAEGR